MVRSLCRTQRQYLVILVGIVDHLYDEESALLKCISAGDGCQDATHARQGTQPLCYIPSSI